MFHKKGDIPHPESGDAVADDLMNITLEANGGGSAD